MNFKKNNLIINKISLNLFEEWVTKMANGFNMNRINPNQTQIFFDDGRYETLTDAELEAFLSEAALFDREEIEAQDPMN